MKLIVNGQDKVLPDDATLRELIEDTETRRLMLLNLQEVKRRLGPPGASERAAAEILDLINGH